MARPLIATVAKQLLYQASQRLGAADPRPDVSEYIEESLAVPVGEPLGERQRPLEPSFSETTPENLSFMVGAHPGLSPSDRIELSTHAISKVVGSRFGKPAENWLAQHTEAPRSHSHSRSSNWGATFSSAFDRNGIAEAAVHYEWGPLLMDALPAPLFRIARTALETIPGLRPALSSIRCGRTSGSQQITFEIERPLDLNALRPLMDRLGIGHQHAGLMSTAAFILGARFTLPPETAMLTLRPARNGVELRLDVDLDALPDPPSQLLSLIRIQSADRPSTARSLDRFLGALTPDGYPGPGTVSILSVWVRPDMPARIALYLNPAALQVPRSAPAPQPAAPPRVPQPAAAEASWSSAAWAP